MRTFTIAAAAIAGTFAVAATAQETPAASAAPTQEAAPAQETAPAPAEGTAGTSATATTVSDAEVTQFATALAAVDKINKDAATPATEKQAKMAAAVTSAGLTPERFNSIGQSLSKDPALQAKVAAAVQAKAGKPS